MKNIPQNIDPNLFQYKNSNRFVALLQGMYSEINKSSMGCMDVFLDYTQATGDWLTQLAWMFNVPRVLSGLVNAFILDVSELDGTDVLDGTATPLDDDILRALFIAKIMKDNTKIKTVEYIYSVLALTINPDTMSIVQGNKSLDINVTITDTESMRRLVALNSYYPKWFGCPDATSVTWNIT